VTNQPASKSILLFPGFIFVFLAAVIGILSAQFYFKEEKLLKAEAQQSLSTIADLKVNQITNWRREREGDTFSIQNNAAIARSVKDYFQDNTRKPDLNRWMDAFCKSYGYWCRHLI